MPRLPGGGVQLEERLHGSELLIHEEQGCGRQLLLGVVHPGAEQVGPPGDQASGVTKTSGSGWSRDGPLPLGSRRAMPTPW